MHHGRRQSRHLKKMKIQPKEERTSTSPSKKQRLQFNQISEGSPFNRPGGNISSPDVAHRSPLKTETGDPSPEMTGKRKVRRAEEEEKSSKYTGMTDFQGVLIGRDNFKKEILQTEEFDLSNISGESPGKFHDHSHVGIRWLNDAHHDHGQIIDDSNKSSREQPSRSKSPWTLKVEEQPKKSKAYLPPIRGFSMVSNSRIHSKNEWNEDERNPNAHDHGGIAWLNNAGHDKNHDHRERRHTPSKRSNSPISNKFPDIPTNISAIGDDRSKSPWGNRDGILS